jgi:hypothetical protein
MFSPKWLGLGCVVVIAVGRLAPAPRVTLEDQDLTGASLRDRHWAHARLGNAELVRADLTGSDLRGADLTKTCLASAVLHNANLSGADLQRADLMRADLTGANLTGADLRAAIYDRFTRWPAGFTVAGTGLRLVARRRGTPAFSRLPARSWPSAGPGLAPR